MLHIYVWSDCLKGWSFRTLAADLRYTVSNPLEDAVAKVRSVLPLAIVLHALNVVIRVP
jgi:hypothetical protein